MKKTLHILLAFAMLFSLTTTAFAASSPLAMVAPASADNAVLNDEYSPALINIDEEIERALNGDTDLEIDADSIASAWLEDEDGNKQDVEFLVTTRELPTTKAINGGKKFYATTVVAGAKVKPETNSDELNGVTGTVTLYWIDNLGVGNELVSVNGSWKIVKDPNTGIIATLSKKHVVIFGKYALGGEQQEYTQNISDNSYSFNIEATKDIILPGYTLYSATSYATLNGNPKTVLKVEAKTSIFTK